MQVTYELTAKDFRDAFLSSRQWFYRTSVVLCWLTGPFMFAVWVLEVKHRVSHTHLNMATAVYWGAIYWPLLVLLPWLSVRSRCSPNLLWPFMILPLAILAITLQLVSHVHTTFAAVSIIIVGYWLSVPWWLVWLFAWLFSRSEFSRQPSAQGPRALSWNASGVHWRWDGGSADYGWKNILRCSETKNHLLVYLSQIDFDVVPKRAFHPGQLDDFFSLAENYVPTTRVTGKVMRGWGTEEPAF